VFNNEDLNEVTWEQRVMEGDPRFETTQSLPNVPYAEFAEMLGLEGVFVDTPDALGAAWDNALAADRPVLIEVKTDPNVAPLPPHVTLAQAKAFMSSMRKDRNAMDVIADTARQVIEGIRERL